MLRRRLILAALGIAVLGVGGLSVYWLWASEQVSLAIAQWTTEQRGRGYDIAYDGPDISGYPARLAVRFGAPRIAAPQGWRWSGAEIAGEAAFWAPQTLRLELPRRQTLSADWRGLRRELTLEAEDARGRITLGRAGWMTAATIEMDAITLTEQGGDSLRAETLRYDLTHRPPTLEGRDDWTVLARGETLGIVLPDGTASPLGQIMERLAFDTTVIGLVPQGEPAAALVQWRDAGGRLQVHELALLWGRLDLRAAGQATLDEFLRPQGVFTARIRGLPETLDLLAARGLITSGMATTLKFSALALAAKRDQNGATVVELPVTLQDGLLFLGPVALFRLAPVL